MKYDRIKILRKKFAYTQQQVADHIGVSRSMYSHYETGRTQIPLNSLIDLANYYGASVDYLIGLDVRLVSHKRPEQNLF